MTTGCLRGFFERVGCVTVLVVGGAGAWYFRDELASAYRGAVTEFRAPAVTATEVQGVPPSPAARREAEALETEIARADGPALVVFSTEQAASLLDRRLDQDARRALDSIRVTLGADRLTLEGQLLTDVFGRDLLGPLARVIDSREPIRMSGRADVVGPGVLAWGVDQFSVRGFPFPRVAIPRLLDRLSAGSEGMLPVSIPATVRDVRIRDDGLTFYR